jgi:hypothetical protein
MRLDIAGHLDEAGGGARPEERAQNERPAAPGAIARGGCDQERQDQPSEAMPPRDGQPDIGSASQKSRGRAAGLAARGSGLTLWPVWRE